MLDADLARSKKKSATKTAAANVAAGALNNALKKTVVPSATGSTSSTGSTGSALNAAASSAIKGATAAASGSSGGSSKNTGGGYTSTGSGSNVSVANQQLVYDPSKMYADLYEDMKAALARQQAAAQAQQQAAINQGVNTLSAEKPKVESGYQDAARQAYIQMMQSRRELPQVMAAQGLGGGLTESSLVDIDTTYGNNLNALRAQRDQTLSDIDLDIANLRATGDISIAQSASDYAQKLYDLAAQQMQQEADLLSRYGLSESANTQSTGTTVQLKNLLSNPYVKRAEEAYEGQPTAMLDYLSSHMSADEMDLLINYYGFSPALIQQWLNSGGTTSLPSAAGSAASSLAGAMLRRSQ